VHFRRVGTNYGVFGNVNGNWSGTQSPPSSDFSITELTASCFNASGKQELVGVAMGRHPGVYGSRFTLLAEYAINGTYHWITGGGNSGAYVQTSSTFAPGLTITSQSVINGAQFESSVAWVYFPAQWWLYFQGQPIGRVNDSNFSTLNSGSSSCWNSWYGEEYDPDHSTTTWSAEDLTSGILPPGANYLGDYLKSGWIRLPTYYTSVNAGSVATWSSNALTSGFGYDPNCYDGWNTHDGPANYNPTIFLSGPGGGGSCL